MVDDLAKAGRMFTECIELRERLSRFGTREVEVALRNLAAVFLEQGKDAEAGPFLIGADAIKKYLELNPTL